jgi:predicted nuclease of restriction endonuclease-like RecB superfamily
MAKPRSNRRHVSSLYRSGLEERTAKNLDDLSVPYQFETLKLPYIIPASNHKYTPDFLITTKSGKTLIIETKGIWAFDDRKKHLLIREQHPDLDIRFVFSRSKSKISKKSTTTYADICNGLGRGKFKGITWKYADSKIPQEWIDE